LPKKLPTRHLAELQAVWAAGGSLGTNHLRQAFLSRDKDAQKGNTKTKGNRLNSGAAVTQRHLDSESYDKNYPG